jgi:deoxyribodipyrimidine photo-lyase
MRTTIVLFTRDLRTHDHPALHAAAESDAVVPLFVLDEHPLRTFGGVNRVHFLLEALEDLRDGLRQIGADLWVRRGDTVYETLRLARDVDAAAIYVTTDASAFAHLRLQRLQDEREFEVKTFPGIAAVDPGTLAPGSGDHYRVFTPYLRAWLSTPKREVLSPPKTLRSPSSPPPGRIPLLRELSQGRPSAGVARGGESHARKRAAAWFSSGASSYDNCRNDLAEDGTSRLSAYLHFGCVSPLEMIAETPRGQGGREWVRQLCWRDFFLQVLAATPDYPRSDYRPRNEEWVEDEGGLERWKAGVTGIPLVDAGMRQLVAEGWMHNRARLVTASFLTRSMNIDWREGAQHFWELLADGDLASNAGNWQWVAGTGNATRRGRAMNPLRQGKRFDPNGDFVRRYVPELADLAAPVVHEPWRLGAQELKRRGYPMALSKGASGLAIQGALQLRAG